MVNLETVNPGGCVRVRRRVRANISPSTQQRADPSYAALVLSGINGTGRMASRKKFNASFGLLLEAIASNKPSKHILSFEYVSLMSRSMLMVLSKQNMKGIGAATRNISTLQGDVNELNCYCA
eukprot:GHVU01053895.1.p1 GENE.GHVU01053895.1~~GHVU01053895.1.p1  ORF type:complete len:123 (-),score=1.71 GHVU01053895.1:98-466(-)